MTMKFLEVNEQRQNLIYSLNNSIENINDQIN